MTWVRRAQPSDHTCNLPKALGSRDDLWRCDECLRLWRIGYACDRCEALGDGHHLGQCVVGLAWRPATFWQRFLFQPPNRPPPPSVAAGPVP